jgi:hypothetical protein
VVVLGSQVSGSATLFPSFSVSTLPGHLSHDRFVVGSFSFIMLVSKVRVFGIGFQSDSFYIYLLLGIL